MRRASSPFSASATRLSSVSAGGSSFADPEAKPTRSDEPTPSLALLCKGAGGGSAATVVPALPAACDGRSGAGGGVMDSPALSDVERCGAAASGRLGAGGGAGGAALATLGAVGALGGAGGVGAAMGWPVGGSAMLGGGGGRNGVGAARVVVERVVVVRVAAGAERRAATLAGGFGRCLAVVPVRAALGGRSLIWPGSAFWLRPETIGNCNSRVAYGDRAAGAARRPPPSTSAIFGVRPN